MREPSDREWTGFGGSRGVVGKLSVKLKRIGVNEQFGEVGTLEELIARFRFTPEDIASDVKQFLKK